MAPSITPEYANAYIGNELKNFAIAMIVILVLFVALRFIARVVSNTKFGADDYVTIPALISSIALCAVSILIVTIGGGGKHLLVVFTETPEKLVNLQKLEIAFACAYLCATTFPKISMLLLFLRIFIAKWSRRACYALIAILSATLFANIMAALLQCIPLAYAWNPAGHPGGHCFNQNQYWRWGQFPNIITDIFMIGLPFPALFKLQTSWKDKIGIILTFAAGSTGLITSILRFVAFFTTDGDGPTADGTWAVINLAIYSIAEAGVYLIASCLPPYRSLYLTVKRIAPLSRSQSTNGYFSRWTRGTRAGQVSENSTPLSTYPTASKSGFKTLEGDDQNFLMDESRAPSTISHSEVYEGR